MEMERLFGKKPQNVPTVQQEPKWVFKKDGEGIDWRKKGVETPVKDQGQCGDPNIFSAVDEMSMAHTVREGHKVALSTQQLVDCYSTGNPCGDDKVENPYHYI